MIKFTKLTIGVIVALLIVSTAFAERGLPPNFFFRRQEETPSAPVPEPSKGPGGEASKALSSLLPSAAIPTPSDGADSGVPSAPAYPTGSPSLIPPMQSYLSNNPYSQPTAAPTPTDSSYGQPTSAPAVKGAAHKMENSLISGAVIVGFVSLFFF